MKPVRIGPMRHLVSIQASTDTRNSFGEPVESFAEITNGSQWASIEPLSGREFLAAQQVSSELTHRITTRYVSGVTAKMQIVYGSRTFDILNVRDVEERGRKLEMLCVERFK